MFYPYDPATFLMMLGLMNMLRHMDTLHLFFSLSPFCWRYILEDETKYLVHNVFSNMS